MISIAKTYLNDLMELGHAINLVSEQEPEKNEEFIKSFIKWVR